VLVTHDAAEANHRAAVDAIAGLDVVKQVAGTLRVVGT
jgi:hypothetical protein